jgi:uncharacterized protein (TIGR02466 family)
LIRKELFSTPLWRTTLPNSIDLQWLFDLAVQQQSEDSTLNSCNGWQSHTSGKTMQYLLPVPVGLELQDFLDTQMNTIAQELGLPNINLLNYWLNINPPGSYNELHKHSNSLLVGNLYLKAPKHSGDIEFIRNDENDYFTSKYPTSTDPVLATKQSITPAEREIYIFPGWLQHGVKLNNSTSDRISFSFNYGAI